MAKKYEFFDSGLLYQFCINFRRRRRLSELLRESEQDDDKVSTQEDSRGDSPSVRHKSSPQEGDNAFQSGKRTSPSFLHSIRVVCKCKLSHYNAVAYLIAVRVSKDLTSVTGGRRGSSNSAQLQSSGFPLLVQLSSSSVRCNPESGERVINIHVTIV